MNSAILFAVLSLFSGSDYDSAMTRAKLTGACYVQQVSPGQWTVVQECDEPDYEAEADAMLAGPMALLASK